MGPKLESHLEDRGGDIANAEFHYDFFISYSHHDKEWVHGWLLPQLEAAGLRVCIDFRDFELGLSSLINMEKAVERSRKTLIVLTPEWMASEWTTFESLLIQTDDPAGRQRRMVPLLLKPCKLPKRIAMLTYVDFTKAAEVKFQLQRLVMAIREDAPPISLPSPQETQEDEQKGEREQVAPEEFIQLPEVEVVTPGGRLIRGWLVRTFRSGTVIAITGLIIAILACVGTYLAVPQVQEFIALRLATPANRCPTVTLFRSPEQITPGAKARLTAKVDDPENDQPDYLWEATAPGLQHEGGPYKSPLNEYIAPPDSAGEVVRITVVVDDHRCGRRMEASTVIHIVLPPITEPLAETSTPTLTPTLTVTPTASPTATSMLTAFPTITATPMPSEEVVIEVDGVVADGDRCHEVDCGSFLRIEVVKVLDPAGDQIQPAVLSYNWSFNPSDPHNEDKLDSKNYVINYYVPCELDNQTVTIEVLDGETLGVRSIRFNIKE